MNLRILPFLSSFFLHQVRGVINGKATSGKKWMALLRNPTAGHCGGTVYSESTIITAAHCSVSDTSNWKAYPSLENWINLGDANNPGLAVLERFNHPGFNENQYYYDISVWWIDGKTNERTGVTLAETSDFNDMKSEVYFVGWGITNVITEAEKIGKSFVPIFANGLQKGIVSLVKDEDCYSAYKNRMGYFVPQIMFCTVEKNGDSVAGLGDSGGPIYRNNNNGIVLLGVVSKSIGCGYEKYKDINTRIPEPNIKKFLLHYINEIDPSRVKNGKIIKNIPAFKAPNDLISLNTEESRRITSQKELCPPSPIRIPVSPIHSQNPSTSGRLSPSSEFLDSFMTGFKPIDNFTPQDLDFLQQSSSSKSLSPNNPLTLDIPEGSLDSDVSLSPDFLNTFDNYQQPKTSKLGPGLQKAGTKRPYPK